MPTAHEGYAARVPSVKNLPGAAYWARARRAEAGAVQGSTSTSSAHEAPAVSFGDRFDPTLRSVLTKDVPLTHRNDLRLLFVDTELLTALGMPVGKNGFLAPEHEAALLQLSALKPVGAGEIADTTGVATRYADKHGWVQGDGRAVVVGGPRTERGHHGGKAVERPVNLRLKGVGTGLVPRGKDDKLHTTGKMGDDGALADTLISSFFAKNGVRTNRTLAFTGSQSLFEYQINGTTYSSTEGTMLLAGQFDRLGHLLEAERSGKPGAVRALLDDVNAQLCHELGRKQPLSLAGMFSLIAGRKARELADLWWLRSYQGSITYDNIGLFESIDHGTSEALDRTHKGHAFNPGCSAGFGGEPAYVMQVYLARELRRFFVKSATGAERNQLLSHDVDRLVEQVLAERMAANALEHTGFDLDQVKALLKHARPEALAFSSVVRALADETVPGHEHHVVSPFNAAWQTTVNDPARYDVMQALAALPRAMGLLRGGDQGGAVQLVQAALAPLVADASKDADAARTLLRAATPLFERALAGMTPAQSTAQLEIASDLAVGINRPVDTLLRFSLLPWVNDKLAAVKDGRLSVARFRGEIAALLRAHQRRGDESAGHVAMALRHGTLPRDEAGRLVLSSVIEHGVRIEERSDGVSDALCVSLAENPMQLADPAKVKLLVSLHEGHEQTLTPVRTVGGEVFFELPITATGGAPEHVHCRFVADDGTGNRWDLDGFGFGNGHTPLLASRAVQAELAAQARRTGRRRHQTPDAMADAVAGRAPDAVARASTKRPAVDAPTRAMFVARAGDVGGTIDVKAAFLLDCGALGVPVRRANDVVVLAQGPGHSAYVIPPEILDVAEAQGRALGRPVDDAATDHAGRLVQIFEHGRVIVDERGAATVEFGARTPPCVELGVAANAAGAEFTQAVANETTLQEPRGSPFHCGTWHGQRFTSSTASWGDGWLFRNDDGRVTRVVRGFSMFYPASKALLGAPLEDEQADPAVTEGVVQRFERGVMTWNPRDDVRVRLT